MMRKSSVHSIRPSHAGSLVSQVSNAHLKAKLAEEKKEFEALLAIETLSSEFVRRLESVDIDCTVMADAEKVFGDALCQWSEMFRILDLCVPRNTEQNAENGTEAAQVAVERLVRIPLEDLH